MRDWLLPDLDLLCIISKRFLSAFTSVAGIPRFTSKLMASVSDNPLLCACCQICKICWSFIWSTRVLERLVALICCAANFILLVVQTSAINKILNKYLICNFIAGNWYLQISTFFPIKWGNLSFYTYKPKVNPTLAI